MLNVKIMFGECKMNVSEKQNCINIQKWKNRDKKDCLQIFAKRLLN